MGSFDLGQPGRGWGFPWSLVKRQQRLGAGHCASVQPCGPLIAARLRMRESLCAPAAMQGLLQYLHPRRAGRSLVASAEKHLYARGTALWTHIRDLVCRGKVGQQVGLGFQVGWEGRGPCYLLV